MKATCLGALLCVLVTPACRLSEDAPASEGSEPSALGVQPEPGERPRPDAPAGFTEMSVADVVPEGDGHVVLLADAQRELFLPIVVGGSEALAIHLRSGRRRFQRPLTHDLFDRLLREADGRLLKVHVDALDDGVFLGAIFLELGARPVKLDARPSDAIALALGNSAPIYVAKSVIEGAAVQADRAANRLDSLLERDRDGKDPLKL